MWKLQRSPKITHLCGFTSVPLHFLPFFPLKFSRGSLLLPVLLYWLIAVSHSAPLYEKRQEMKTHPSKENLDAFHSEPTTATTATEPVKNFFFLMFFYFIILNSNDFELGYDQCRHKTRWQHERHSLFWGKQNPNKMQRLKWKNTLFVTPVFFLLLFAGLDFSPPTWRSRLSWRSRSSNWSSPASNAWTWSSRSWSTLCASAPPR